MLDPSTFELKGARHESQYTSLHAVAFIGGLETQRSPFSPIDTRYGRRFMGGKQDTLLDGSNCEISNRLTLIRRPGLSAFGVTAIPKPLAFYTWQRAVSNDLLTVVDTASALYRYSPTHAGIYFNKAAGAGQTSVFNVVQTLYCGDGVDLFKIVGPNLLKQSTAFDVVTWTYIGATGPVTGQTDPKGGTNAVKVTYNLVSNYIYQRVVPNYTPIASNTFTFSVWLKASTGTPTIDIKVQDQTGTVGSSTVTLSTSWARYELTATMGAGSTDVRAYIGTPSATGDYYLYGSQLEVGGPSTPVQITTNLPQGVYKWGIGAPTTAPVAMPSNFGNRWAAATIVTLGYQITDANGYVQTVTVGGTTGTHFPLFATTQGSTTTDGSVTWRNDGKQSGGLSPAVGYQYYYAYGCSLTGHYGPVSPISANTGPMVAQQDGLSGDRSSDPQVDIVGIFRNTDGGAFYFLVNTVANPAVGSWTYTDTTSDDDLNTSIYAPIGDLNAPPPAGLTNLEYHQGRLWGSVGAYLYAATLADNAALLNVVQNGVPAESWTAVNVFPLDAPVVRSISTTSALLIWTTSDLNALTGTGVTTFSAPTKALRGHGLRSWNALSLDGADIYVYLSDRQFIRLSPASGSEEFGFSIGNVLESTFDPSSVYVSRHVGGTSDSAVFLANGSTGWHRMNPNQVGASLSGEQTPVWSPLATVNGGSCGAIGSVETSPGVHQLLVGQTSAGVVLKRDLTTHQDNGTPFTWSATIGSIYLALSGELAVVESLSVESLAAVPTVGALLDEISGSFETLPDSVNDPPQLTASVSLNSRRFYLSQGATPPLCKHLQIKLSGAAANTADEILTIGIRGELVAEQT